MGIVASITVAYPEHVDFFEEIKPVIEEMLGTQTPHKPRTAVVGSTGSRIVNVELPDNFDIRSLKSQMPNRLPDVNVNVVTSFRKPIWERRGMDAVIAVTSGIAVALVLDAMRLLLPSP